MGSNLKNTWQIGSPLMVETLHELMKINDLDASRGGVGKMRSTNLALVKVGCKKLDQFMQHELSTTVDFLQILYGD